MTREDMEQLITEYGDDLYRFCIHLTGKTDLAEELYQDTFVKVIQLRHRLKKDGNVKSYLMGIAVNLWKNRMRKENGRKQIAPQADFEQAVFQAADEAMEPLQRILEEERNRILYQAVRTLSWKLRMVIFLYYSGADSPDKAFLLDLWKEPWPAL